jgi:hypothetical protein
MSRGTTSPGPLLLALLINSAGIRARALLLQLIVFVPLMRAIGAPGGGSDTAMMPREVAGDSADNRIFDAAAWLCVGWAGQGRGNKTGNDRHKKRFSHQALL